MSKAKILIIGRGGREHSLGKKLLESSHVKKIYFAKGNGGTQVIGNNVNIDELNFKNLSDFAKEKKIDLTIVGPEISLANGIVNYFTQKKLRIFGPTKWAAEIETNKAKTKQFFLDNKIPTANFKIFSDAKLAKDYLKNIKYPTVIKASGLCEGKGVSICTNLNDAINCVTELMINSKFGKSGEKIVIEEYLEGSEFSILALTDGREIRTLMPAQDYKQAFNWDYGPNTGGMGSYAPHHAFIDDTNLEDKIKKEILEPTIQGMKHKPYRFKGCLFLGGILTKTGAKVIEYNSRFGDPETQAILPLLKNDLYELLSEIVDGKLTSKIENKKEHSVCVVLASRGYPHNYKKEFAIHTPQILNNQVQIYHAGTKFGPSNKVYTAGGRVINICAQGKTLESARKLAYEYAQKINIPGGFHYRDDIAKYKR